MVVSESFTHSAAVEGKLLVGGLTSAVEPLGEEERVRSGELLYQTLSKQRNDLVFLPALFAADQLGQDAYGTMLDAYRVRDWLALTHMAKLQEAVSDVRYVILGRIVKDEIYHYKATDEDFQGKSIDEAITERSMAVGIRVYDLQTGDVVWEGTASAEQSRKNKYDTEESDADTVLAVLDWLTDDFVAPREGGSSPYPDPPNVSSVLEEAFESFANSLPQPTAE